MLGFLPILARVWWLIPILALTASTAYYRHDAASVRAEFSEFKTQIALTAAKAEAQAKQKETDNANRINHAVASRDAALVSLRRSQARSTSSFVPRDPGAAGADSYVCYDRAKLDGSLRVLDSGIQDIAGSGAEAVINLLTILQSWPR